MRERTGGPYALLNTPALYDVLQRMLGAAQARRRFVAEFLRPDPGVSILDIGCGTGAILDDLPRDVRYTGFDANERYVRAAGARGDARATFFHASVGDDLGLPRASFDMVMARAVLHHLDDSLARRLVREAHGLLRPGGVFVSIDPVFHDRQSVIARTLAAADRGRHVRSVAACRAILAAAFVDVEQHVLGDMLRIPYSHCVMRAVK